MNAIKNEFFNLESKIVRNKILDGEPRIDGRDTRTVRPIEIKTGILPRTHGSALFTRGETQAIVVATLGTGRDEQIIDALQGENTETVLCCIIISRLMQLAKQGELVLLSGEKLDMENWLKEVCPLLFQLKRTLIIQFA